MPRRLQERGLLERTGFAILCAHPRFLSTLPPAEAVATAAAAALAASFFAAAPLLDPVNELIALLMVPFFVAVVVVDPAAGAAFLATALGLVVRTTVVPALESLPVLTRVVEMGSGASAVAFTGEGGAAAVTGRLVCREGALACD